MLFRGVKHQYHQFYYNLNQPLYNNNNNIKLLNNFYCDIYNVYLYKISFSCCIYILYILYILINNNKCLQINISFSFNPSEIALISLLLKLFSIISLLLIFEL